MSTEILSFSLETAAFVLMLAAVLPFFVVGKQFRSASFFIMCGALVSGMFGFLLDRHWQPVALPIGIALLFVVALFAPIPKKKPPAP